MKRNYFFLISIGGKGKNSMPFPQKGMRKKNLFNCRVAATSNKYRCPLWPNNINISYIYKELDEYAS